MHCVDIFKNSHSCRQCGIVAYNKCGECYVAYYCNAQCQEKHWPQHKEKCHAEKVRAYGIMIEPPLIQQYFVKKHKKSIVSFKTFRKVIFRKCLQIIKYKVEDHNVNFN